MTLTPERRAGMRGLLTAMDQLKIFAEAYDYAPITTKTLNVSRAFIQCLPENRQLPRIATDEDGFVLLVWHGSNLSMKLGITVENETLRPVVNPGNRSEHLGAIIFNGYVPPSILDHVPIK